MPFRYHTACINFNFLLQSMGTRITRLPASRNNVPIFPMRRKEIVHSWGVHFRTQDEEIFKQWEKRQLPCQQNQAPFDLTLLSDGELLFFLKDIIRVVKKIWILSQMNADSGGCPYYKGDFMSLSFGVFDSEKCMKSQPCWSFLLLLLLLLKLL